MNEVFGDVAGEVEVKRERESTSCLTREELPEEEIHHNQTILEEVFTPDYNVTEEEVLEYCSVLGIDPEREPQLVPLARTALLQPLPKPWAPVKDPRVGVYFFNQATGGSSWAHPVDDIVRGLIAKERAKGTAAHAAAGAGAASAAFCNAHANAAGRGSCTDSCIEDLVTDEDVLVSEFLREASQADHAPSSSSDVASDYAAAAPALGDAFAGSAASRPRLQRPPRPASGAVPWGGRHGSATGRSDDDVTPSEDDLEDVSEGSGGSVIVDRRGAAEPQVLADALGDSRSRPLGKRTDAEPPTTPPAMLGGRDSLGRGLGRAPLGPPPLAHPPLGGPAPLGSIGSMGGGRIPPLGGQHTPLAPIAAAGRGGPHAAQLAPLKPLAPPAAQRPSEGDGRAGMAPLKKQDRLQVPRKEAEEEEER